MRDRAEKCSLDKKQKWRNELGSRTFCRPNRGRASPVPTFREHTVWDRAVVPVRTGAEMAQAQNLGNEETSERLWKGAGFGAGRDGI